MQYFDRILAEALDDSIPDSLITRRVQRWWRVYEPTGVDVYLGPNNKIYLNIDSCKSGHCIEVVNSLQRYVGNHISIYYSDDDHTPEGFELLRAATHKTTAHKTTTHNVLAHIGAQTDEY